LLLRGVGGGGAGGFVYPDFGGGDEEGRVGIFAFGGGGVVAEDVVGEESHVLSMVLPLGGGAG